MVFVFWYMDGTKQMTKVFGCEHEIDLDTIKYHKRGRVGLCKKCKVRVYLIMSREHPKPRTRPKGSKKARKRARQKIKERNGSPSSLPT